MIRLRVLRSILLASVLCAASSAVAFAGDVQADRALKDAWPVFRGSLQNRGTTAATLPEKLDVLWQFDAPDAVIATAAIAGDRIYIGTDAGTVHALTLEDGKEVWSYKTPEEDPVRSSPTITGGLVIFGDSGGFLHALDAQTGKEKWKFETMGEIISGAQPIGDRVVFGSYDGVIYALNRNDGSLAWKYETEGRVHGTPGYYDGMIYAVGCDEHLYQLDAKTGEKKASLPMGSVAGVSAAIDGGKMVLGTYGNKVIGVDVVKGEVLWTFEDPDRQFPFMSSTAIDGGVAVLGGRDKRVRALDVTSGSQRWVFQTKARVESSPVIVQNRVFVGSNDGTVYALNLGTGKQEWSFETGAPVSSSPAVVEGRLVIGNEDGVLYCFGAK